MRTMAVKLDTIADFLSCAIEHGVCELGGTERHPIDLRASLGTYEVEMSTTASLRTFNSAVMPTEVPSNKTIAKYRNILSWL